MPAGPEPIPAGVCAADDPKQTFMGSSGFRRIPGNTCDASKGKEKDKPVEKSCANGKFVTSVCETSPLISPKAQPPDGEVIHNTVSNSELSLLELSLTIYAVRIPITCRTVFVLRRLTGMFTITWRYL